MLPPGKAGMLDLWAGLALYFVDFGLFQASRSGCDRYSTRFDINSKLICFAVVRFDTGWGRILMAFVVDVVIVVDVASTSLYRHDFYIYGLFPSGNQSMEVGWLRPPPQLIGSRRETAARTPKIKTKHHLVG